MNSAANAVLVIGVYGRNVFGEQDLADLQRALKDNLSAASRGTHLSEQMLLAQAHALQSMFVHLADRAARQEQVGYIEVFTRLALKAQSQCRATLETVALIRNPPNVSIVRQANIGAAVQVNNGPTAPPPDSKSARLNPSSDLSLEEGHGQRMDHGATHAAGNAHSALATVGALHRPDQ